MYFVSGEMDDPGLYARLRERLDQVGAEGVLYYLAIPPTAYGPVVEALGAAGLAGTRGERLAPADRREAVRHRSRAARSGLNALLHQHFDEEQIFRIDHYLGKETVQNLLVFRFANGMFEPIWNRRYIDHVQITAAETVGVERRAAYYEGAGALRDMVQNHLMQLLALVAMEPPIAFNAEQRARSEDGRAAGGSAARRRTAARRHVVRAQYADGWVNGDEVPGYRVEPGVGPGLDDRDLRRAAAASSTAGAGRACRSICAPASGCRSG